MSVLKNSLRQKFAQIPNELITDTRLSNGAFRVAAYLYSRPDNWAVNNKDVQLQLAIKNVGTVSKYWQELIAAGWVNREERAGENGQFGGFNYTLLMSSTVAEINRCGKTPLREKPVTVKNRNGKNQQHNNKEILNNTELDINTDFADESAKQSSNEKPKQTKSIEERAADFKERIRQNKNDYPNAMLHDFYNYWTEHNEGGKKMRFEIQKIFDIKRRLATWNKNNKDRAFNKSKEQKQEASAVYVAPRNEHFARIGLSNPLESLAAEAAKKMRM